jgi:hypothetical protein
MMTKLTTPVTLLRNLSQSRSRNDGSQASSLTRTPSLQESQRKPLPELPPVSIGAHLDPPAAGPGTRAAPANFSDDFLRRLDRAAVKASTEHRTVTPLGILDAFRKEGIDLRGQPQRQASLTDGELEARGAAAYDASLPKPRRHT